MEFPIQAANKAQSGTWNNWGLFEEDSVKWGPVPARCTAVWGTLALWRGGVPAFAAPLPCCGGSEADAEPRAQASGFGTYFHSEN